jgi:hypothetical protein
VGIEPTTEGYYESNSSGLSGRFGLGHVAFSQVNTRRDGGHSDPLQRHAPKVQSSCWDRRGLIAAIESPFLQSPRQICVLDCC